MTDLREAYKLENFGENTSCGSGNCIAFGCDDYADTDAGECTDKSCYRDLVTGLTMCNDGTPAKRTQSSGSNYCCPSFESFGNVRRPRRLVRRRREGFGNVRRHCRRFR